MANNKTPLESLGEMVSGANGLVDFLKREANNPNLTPEQKVAIDKAISDNKVYEKSDEINNLHERLKKHLNDSNKSK